MPRPPLAVPLAALAGFVALLGLVVGRWPPLVAWDAAMSARARGYGHQHPGWVATLRVVTDIGATVPFLAVGAVLTVALLLLRRYADAAVTGCVTAVVPLTWAAAHAWLYRPRPLDGFVVPLSNGYPSGHTSNATALALLGVLLLWPRLRRAGRLVAVVAAVLLAGFVGLTRVALLAHWPSDVLGGWLLGIAIVPLCGAVGAAYSRTWRSTRRS